MIRVSIVGGSGFVGGELLRLLVGHPDFVLGQATSERHAGRFVHTVHPPLRGRTELRFCRVDQLETCDVLLLALPHGSAASRLPEFERLGARIVDCSADFRLRSPEDYGRYYGEDHPRPERLADFVYGLPEIERGRLGSASRVSGVGCNATAVNLALLPLVRAGVVRADTPVIADLKVGSAESGRGASAASHHPERSGALRSFAPVGHRHLAEVEQALGLRNVRLTVTSVERVRGVLATCHVLSDDLPDERTIARIYREHCRDEPFLRVVHGRSGLFRQPDPRVLDGTNYVDLGWALEDDGRRLVALAALDNLGKGAAGTAVQCLNLMHELPESRGLEFTGIYP